MTKDTLNPNIDFKQEAEMYKSMYIKLFNSVTDALTALDKNSDFFKLSCILKYAQSECEEIYIAA